MKTLNDAEVDGITFSHRPLGRLLLDSEFVRGSDLAHALVAQQSSNQQIGQILVELGRLEPADLNAVLTIQPYTARLADALKLAAGIRKRLGELLLTARRITPDQLNDALEAQRQSGKRLGEILVEKKLLRAGELDALLRFQHSQSAASQAAKPLQLGEILVGLGNITRQQLDDALARQAHTHRKLGELLIEAGHLSHEILIRALHLQQKLVVAALIAVLSLGSLSSPASAVEGIAPVRASQHLDFRIVIPEVLQLNLINQTHTLTVTAEDVERGFVDIVAGTNVEIVSNTRSGFALHFQMHMPEFTEVEVRGMNENIVVRAEGASLASHQWPAIRKHYELSYRFKVPTNMPTGVYPFPLQMSVSRV